MTLDDILALLTGRKVKQADGMWRIYTPDGTELTNESGTLLHGLHGFLLAQGAISSDYIVSIARRLGRR